MDEPGAMDGRQGSAQVLADQHRLGCAQLALIAHDVGERLPAHELHAQANAIGMRLDPEHTDDVVMLDFCERTAFLEEALSQPRIADTTMQDLDRDVILEVGIPCPVDAAVAAFADLVRQPILAPRVRGRARRAICRRRRRHRGLLVVRRRIAMQLDDVVEHAKALGPLARAARRDAIDCAPINGEPVGDLFDGFVENRFRHVASPRRDASWRG